MATTSAVMQPRLWINTKPIPTITDEPKTHGLTPEQAAMLLPLSYYAGVTVEKITGLSAPLLFGLYPHLIVEATPTTYAMTYINALRIRYGEALDSVGMRDAAVKQRAKAVEAERLAESKRLDAKRRDQIKRAFFEARSKRLKREQERAARRAEKAKRKAEAKRAEKARLDAIEAKRLRAVKRKQEAKAMALARAERVATYLREVQRREDQGRGPRRPVPNIEWCDDLDLGVEDDYGL